MKYLFSIVVLSFLLSCSNNSYEEDKQTRESPKSEIVKVGNIEVMTKDLGKMYWDIADGACTYLRDGWRLPTKKELNLLYENKEKIGGFKNSNYWSSTGNWTQNMTDGLQGKSPRYYKLWVRAVRDPKSKIKSLKLGHLEVATEDLGQMVWKAANKACANLGEGWRLPTKEELNMLYENRQKIGGFKNSNYWSSTEAAPPYNHNFAWLQFFSSGGQSDGSKHRCHYVRAVRDI